MTDHLPQIIAVCICPVGFIVYGIILQVIEDWKARKQNEVKRTDRQSEGI